jgi:hypothetical protein
MTPAGPAGSTARSTTVDGLPFLQEHVMSSGGVEYGYFALLAGSGRAQTICYHDEIRIAAVTQLLNLKRTGIARHPAFRPA